jgi:DNA-directed RNA polymerase sigma subunit (sigma70/sigma32)
MRCRNCSPRSTPTPACRELGISKERVRQIRDAAEKKLRDEFVVLALWQSVLSAR